MADLDVRVIGTIKCRLEPIIPHKQLCSGQESQYRTLTHTGISNHNDCFIGVGVLGDPTYPVMDHVLQLAQVYGVVHFVLCSLNNISNLWIT